MDSTYTLNGSQILSVTTEKDLSIHVSTKLSWNYHIDVIISKANKMVGMIKRTCTSKCDLKTQFNFIQITCLITVRVRVTGLVTLH